MCGFRLPMIFPRNSTKLLNDHLAFRKGKYLYTTSTKTAPKTNVAPEHAPWQKKHGETSTQTTNCWVPCCLWIFFIKLPCKFAWDAKPRAPSWLNCLESLSRFLFFRLSLDTTFRFRASFRKWAKHIRLVVQRFFSKKNSNVVDLLFGLSHLPDRDPNPPEV